jgi:uncharacterized membrane protein/cytochrome c5
MMGLPILADELPPAAVAVGRLHPLMVHLPIGLVLGAFAVEAWRALCRRRECSAFTPVALWLGAAGAVAATASGLAFAEEHGGGDDLFWHRWLGILLTAALVGLAWLASRAARPGDAGRQVTPVLRGSLLASTVLLAWVGHLGGNMVWGEDYVLEPFREKAAEAMAPKDAAASTGARAGSAAPVAAPAADADRMTFYATKVLPLLTERCYECHGNGKRKGGLRMDVRSSIAGRNEDGQWIAQPGDPAHSLLIERCLLPADDDEAMPPEGDRLRAAELDVLRRWIEDGVTMPETAEPAPAAAQAAAARPRVAEGLAPLSPAEIADASALRARGINAVPVSQGASTFMVSVPGGREVGDANLSALFPIAGKIEELSLARSAVTDAGALRMPPLPAVRSVRLDNTALTDVGIAAVLSRTLDAEVVNLVGTGATDAVFAALSQLPFLRRAYVFDTAVTAAGIDAFRARRPGVEIVVEQGTAGVGSVQGPPVSGP